jgi:hypothetical protein
MSIELRRFDDDGKTIVLGTITMTDGELVGDTKLAKRVLQETFYDPQRNQLLSAENGEAFLEALHRNLTGAYLWATKPA